MPIIEKHWESLSDEHWDRLAVNWLRCIRENKNSDPDCEKWWNIVVNLGLFGTAEPLWRFIKLTISLAETEDELSHIAAAPIEYLLGRFGTEYIDRVEAEVKNNPKLVSAIKSCNQYQMTDAVWERVRSIQAT